MSSKRGKRQSGSLPLEALAHVFQKGVSKRKQLARRCNLIKKAHDRKGRSHDGRDKGAAAGQGRRDIKR